jgi:hypothetical protein
MHVKRRDTLTGRFEEIHPPVAGDCSMWQQVLLTPIQQPRPTTTIIAAAKAIFLFTLCAAALAQFT